MPIRWSRATHGRRHGLVAWGGWLDGGHHRTGGQRHQYAINSAGTLIVGQSGNLAVYWRGGGTVWTGPTTLPGQLPDGDGRG